MSYRRLAILFYALSSSTYALAIDQCLQQSAEYVDVVRSTKIGQNLFNSRVQSVRSFQEGLVARGECLPEHAPEIYTHGVPTKKVAIVIHGVSESSLGMHDLSQAYKEAGMNVLEVHLTGHGTEPNALKQINSPDAWRADVRRAIEQAQQLGDEVVLVGYSVGSSLALDAVLNPANKGLIHSVSLHSPPIQYEEFQMKPILEKHAAGDSEWANREPPPPDQPFDRFRYSGSAINVFPVMNNLANEVNAKLAAQPLGVPVGVVYTGKDKTASKQATQEFIVSQNIPPERVRFIPGGNHEASVRDPEGKLPDIKDYIAGVARW